MEPIQLRPRAVGWIDEQGRIEIPAELRAVLFLRPGAKVTLLVDDGELHIIPARTAIRRVPPVYQEYVPGSGDSVDDFIAERHREAERESQD